MVGESLAITEKTFVLGIVGGTLSAALVSAVPAMTVLLILVVADLVTGLVGSAKCGIKIESNKLRKTITKTLAYLSIVVLTAMIDEAITPEWHLSSFVSGFCAVTELISIVENWSKITGKDYLEKLKDILENFLNSRKPKA